MTSVVWGWFDHGVFDVAGRLDELRCWPTGRLVARREEFVREQRRLHVEELTVLRVLDERGRVDDTLAGRDGVSVRTVRASVEVARALESLPVVAAAAYAGDLSAEQLGPVVQLADEASDAQWAARGAARTAPADLARQVRAASRSRRWRSRGPGTRRVGCGCGGPTTNRCCTCVAGCPM
jgi:hypothetical protein